MAENSFIPPAEAQATPPIEPDAAPRGARSKRRAAKEPEDLCVSWRGVAGHCRGALQLDRQEDSRAAGAAKGQPPQPMLQDNTDNNVQDLKNQLKAEREKEQQQAATILRLAAIPRSQVRRPRSRPPPRPMGRLALLQTAFLASPARKRATGRPVMASSNTQLQLSGTAAGAVDCREGA